MSVRREVKLCKKHTHMHETVPMIIQIVSGDSAWGEKRKEKSSPFFVAFKLLQAAIAMSTASSLERIFKEKKKPALQTYLYPETHLLCAIFSLHACNRVDS